jgi:hypothetical protein
MVSFFPRILSTGSLFSITSDDQFNSSKEISTESQQPPAGVVCKDGVCELPSAASVAASSAQEAPTTATVTDSGAGAGAGEKKKTTLRSRMLDLESKVMSEWSKATTSND